MYIKLLSTCTAVPKAMEQRRSAFWSQKIPSESGGWGSSEGGRGRLHTYKHTVCIYHVHGSVYMHVYAYICTV